MVSSYHNDTPNYLSPFVGPKKEIVGGPNALPTDFQPKIKFVEEKDLKAKPEKRFVREAAWEKKLKRTKELFDFSVLDGKQRH